MKMETDRLSGKVGKQLAAYGAKDPRRTKTCSIIVKLIKSKRDGLNNRHTSTKYNYKRKT